jgi:hypothetical protein
MATTFLVDFWRSIPSAPSSRFDGFPCYPDICYYTTITGWRVRVQDDVWRSPPNLTTRQKIFWNGLAILLLPFGALYQLGKFLSFLTRVIPAYGIYVVWTEALAFPYFRNEWDRWRNESIVVRQVHRDRDTKLDHVLHFVLDGQEYTFADSNSLFREEDENDISFRVNKETSSQPAVASTIIRVVRNEKWKKMCYQAQFSWIRSPLKLLLGMFWLRFVWVIILNLFFLAGALMKHIVKEHYQVVNLSIDWTFLLNANWIHGNFLAICFLFPLDYNSVLFRSWNPDAVLKDYTAKPTISKVLEQD